MLDSFEYLTYGFPVVDKTCVIYKSQYYNGKPVGRGREIQRWFLDTDLIFDSNDRPYRYNYCIVDDDSDMLPEQLPYFVQTDNQHGLLDEHVDRIVKILIA
jgi:hypothetical protein